MKDERKTEEEEEEEHEREEEEEKEREVEEEEKVKRGSRREQRRLEAPYPWAGLSRRKVVLWWLREGRRDGWKK